MRMAVGLLLVLLAGCGTEVTELIPRLTCVDGASYTGQGARALDVASEPALTLNGNASAVDGVLRVTSATRNAVGSAYFTTPIAIAEDASLFSYFSQRIGGGDGINGADGLAFVLQSSSQGPLALGLDGGGLGFQNVSPSVVIELDTYPNPPDPVMLGHLGVMLNGEIDSAPLAYAVPPFVLNDGILRHVWVDYDAALQTLSVYVSEQAEKPASALLSYAGLSLTGVLGPSVYAGFSASAGERFNDHELVGAAWIGTSTESACP